jgi:hypothetical protein
MHQVCRVFLKIDAVWAVWQRWNASHELFNCLDFRGRFSLARRYNNNRGLVVGNLVGNVSPGPLLCSIIAHVVPGMPVWPRLVHLEDRVQLIILGFHQWKGPRCVAMPRKNAVYVIGVAQTPLNPKPPLTPMELNLWALKGGRPRLAKLYLPRSSNGNSQR